MSKYTNNYEQNCQNQNEKSADYFKFFHLKYSIETKKSNLTPGRQSSKY
jgi:hypothetical protein